MAKPKKPEENTWLIYGKKLGLVHTDKFSTKIHLPMDPSEAEKYISKTLILEEYKREEKSHHGKKEIHFYKDLSPLSYFRIEEVEEGSYLYFDEKIEKRKIKKILSRGHLIELSDASSTMISDFNELKLLARNHNYDERINPLVNNAIVGQPEEDVNKDKMLMVHIISFLRGLIEIYSPELKEKVGDDIVEKIKPFEIVYGISIDSEAAGMNKPYKDENGCCKRLIRIPWEHLEYPGEGNQRIYLDKIWGLAFSLGCFYKRYGMEDPDRSLSDRVFASHAQLNIPNDRTFIDFKPGERLQKNPPEHLIPVLTILDKIEEKPFSQRDAVIGQIWYNDFGENDLEKVLKFIKDYKRVA